MNVHIGIDGGGTHSRAAAVAEDGRVLAVREGGSLNENNVGRQEVRQHLHALVDGLMREAGMTSFASLTAGLASLDTSGPPEMAEALCAPGWNAESVFLESDARAALAGGTRGGPGMAVICGTGSMILRVDREGHEMVRGGWGYALGDPGGGYELAVQAVRKVLRDDEQGCGSGALKKRVLDYFGVAGPREILPVFYRTPFDPAFPAGLAAGVLELAGNGDREAMDIAENEMRRLAMQAGTMFEPGTGLERVYLYGGIFRHHPWMGERFERELSEIHPVKTAFPEFPPEIGAVLLRDFPGKESAAFYENLKAGVMGRSGIYA